jgi:hypothetical protein
LTRVRVAKRLIRKGSTEGQLGKGRECNAAAMAFGALGGAALGELKNASIANHVKAKETSPLRVVSSSSVRWWS